MWMRALLRDVGASRIISAQGTGVTNMTSTPTAPVDVPEPGSAEELGRFAALQAKLGPLARRVLSDPRAPQTVVVVPSLTLDIEELAKIPGSDRSSDASRHCRLSSGRWRGGCSLIRVHPRRSLWCRA